MSSNARSRKTIRGRWETHFNADVVGGGYAHSFYSYDKRDFQGQSPIVLFFSLGSERVPFGIGTDKHDNLFRFAILSFVKEAASDAGYTAAEVEDALDNLEKAITDCVMDHRKDGSYWTHAYLDQSPSSIMPVVVNNVPYKMEARTLIVEVTDV